jgi:diguanylate cyclase (GGDEF)-like protein
MALRRHSQGLRGVAGVVSAACARHPIRCLVGSITVLAVLIAASCAVLIWNGHQRAILSANRALDRLSLVMVDQADRALQSVDLLLESVAREVTDVRLATPAAFSRQMSGHDVSEGLALRVAPLPQVTSISLIDSHGELVSISSDWPAPRISVADRDYFQALAADPTPRNIVSRPMISRVNGAWSVHVARRLSARDGSFLGIALVSIKLAYFEALYRAVVSGSGFAVALLRADGVLVACYPPQPALIDHTIDLRALRTPAPTRMPHGLGPPDGIDRLAVLRPVPHYPLEILVGRTWQGAFSNWRVRTRQQLAAVVLIEAALAGICLLGARQIRYRDRLARLEATRSAAEERERARRDLLAQYARFGIVLDNLSQGVCMFDARGRLLSANRRLQEMFALAEPPAIGETLSACIVRHAAAGTPWPDSLRRAERTLQRLVAARRPHRAVWELADGRSFACGFQPLQADGWLLTFDDVTAQRRTAARMAFMAHHDPLTGLPNRVVFRERLEAAARRGPPCAVICLDLDRFKEVNDRLGHAAGDALLQEVARRLARCIGPNDTAARLGGDEFAVIQTAVERPEGPIELAQRVAASLSRPCQIADRHVVPGISIGIAMAPRDGATADALLKHADIALYGAKQDVASRIRVFDSGMRARLDERRCLQEDLAQAVCEEQFELYYQPVVHLASRRILGFEALLRWHHPQRGLVLPGTFIGLAEETGLIVPIGEWVLHQACAEACLWPCDITVAVNLSPAQFKRGAVLPAVKSALDRSGLAPERLALEITESALLTDTAETAATMRQLGALGAALVMDDFGTGYCSLSYLHRLPFDKVKIDRSFVQDLGHRPEATAIVRAIIGLCRHLDMTTLAEGIETEAQAAVLGSEGCMEGQGYLFSTPRPAHGIRALLREQETWRAVAG